MRAVSDSSILINLSTIGQLELLNKQFEELFIPKAVWEEVVTEGKGRVGSQEVVNAQWLKVREVSDVTFVRLLRNMLDKGEAEVIALAYELEDVIVLLDEKEARQVANRMGLRMLGTIGLLIKAKMQGQIQSLHEKMEMLKKEAKFRLSDELYEKALQEVGEC